MPELVRIRKVFLVFSGADALSSSDEEGEIPYRFMDGGSNPSDDLENMTTTNPVVDGEDNWEFLRALEELSSHFHGERKKVNQYLNALPPYLMQV